MHALAEFGVALVLGQEVGAGALVARLPGLAAIGAVEHAGRRDADPDALVVFGIDHERMQDQPGAAGLPVLARGMLLQPVDMVPGLAAVVAGEKARRLHAGIKAAVARGQAPADLTGSLPSHRRARRWNASSSRRDRCDFQTAAPNQSLPPRAIYRARGGVGRWRGSSAMSRRTGRAASMPCARHRFRRRRRPSWCRPVPVPSASHASRNASPAPAWPPVSGRALDI